MTLRIYIYALTSVILFSCSSDPSLDKNEKINVVKRNIESSILENNSFIDKLECQTIGHKEAIIYWHFAKNLNNIINQFTSIPRTDISEKDLKTILVDLNKNYHQIIDSTLKSVDFKMFPDKDLSFLNSVKFGLVTSSDNDNSLSYFLTCQQILNEHRQLLELNKVSSSHEHCFDDQADKPH